METYDLEKEIRRILQDSSKIRDYNAKLRSEYMKLNDEVRRLKVENSKLISQNACTEIFLAKSKADNFVKSEEVKSINLLPPEYFNKNDQSDLYIKTGELSFASCKHSASSEQIIPATSSNKISLGGAEGVTKLTSNSIDIDKLLSSMLTYSMILFLMIAIIWIIVVKKLWNGRKKSIQISDLYLQAYLRAMELEG